MRSYDPDRRKILSAVAHASSLVGWAFVPILVPIAILLLSDDPIVKDNAKQSLNFQINIVMYCAIFALLSSLLHLFYLPIGITLLILIVIALIILVIASFVMPIFAIISVASKPDRPYRYPFVYHFF